ncbi:MAG: DUF4174 domain-containing protein [Pseudomonadota bacterium]
MTLKTFLTVLLLGAASAAASQDTAAPDTDPVFGQVEVRDLDQFKWTHRPVVVFADSPFDPAFTEQMELLRARPEALAERDVVVLVDTDPSEASALRQALRPRGFMMVLIGKDGGVKLRKPSPWDVREISRSIDKMPMRQQEIRRAKEAAAGADG